MGSASDKSGALDYKGSLCEMVVLDLLRGFWSDEGLC